MTLSSPLPPSPHQVTPHGCSLVLFLSLEKFLLILAAFHTKVEVSLFTLLFALNLPTLAIIEPSLDHVDSCYWFTMKRRLQRVSVALTLKLFSKTKSVSNLRPYRQIANASFPNSKQLSITSIIFLSLCSIELKKYTRRRATRSSANAAR